MQRIPRVVGVLVVLGAFSVPVAAADPDLGRNLAATCANCHGTNGNSVGETKSLAGMSSEKIMTTLKAYQSGEKTATIMHQLAKGYSDRQLEAIAGYFAAQR